MSVSSSTQVPSVDYRVIPLPRQIQSQTGSFILTQSTRILFQAGQNLTSTATFLMVYIRQATGIVLSWQGVDRDRMEAADTVSLLVDSSLPEEGYQITVRPSGILVAGGSAAGVFYGVQTLRKSIPFFQTPRLELPSVTIKDSPRFPYRGMMLDCARHFFPVQFVKRFIDLIALHGMNRFHWHLTEDQGWRIEMMRHPELTSIGSVRKRTVINRSSVYDTEPHTGYYTQQECRQIVQYAQERFITVIPEIDMPGHMMGALSAYPNLGCTGGPYEVCDHWGVMPDVLCLGNEEVYAFIKDVLDELMEIFPSKYIHIGGDEAPRVRWKACPKCQERIRQEHLTPDGDHTAEDRLQSYFTARVERYLNSKGRSIIGWDEILEGELAPNATVMSWRGVKGGIQAAQMGHDVIMTPTTYAYLDYYQSDKKENEPYGIGGYLPLEKVYEFDPVPPELTPEQAAHVLGGQANLWTEYVSAPAHAEYMVLPRMAAVAEAQWMQPSSRSYGDFLERLPQLARLYGLLGYQYCHHALSGKE